MNSSARSASHRAHWRLFWASSTSPTSFPASLASGYAAPTESRRRGNEFVSIVSDIAILKDWSTLIRATRGTLENLILDQRLSLRTLSGTLSGTRTISWTTRTVRATIALSSTPCQRCLKTVLTPSGHASSLHLHGFDVRPRDDLDVDQPQRLLAVLGWRFKPLGVDVRSNPGRWMLYDREDGVIHDGDGLGGALGLGRR
ncbi:hypothetical protein C8R45DRAFT_125670 [Mycena sanguinolenta]|nr:hypothetical protein C8R45DRAFT_125670 [Mycena sanguinolenta]